MSNEMRNEPLPVVNDNGPLRHFRAGRRAVLQSLAGAGGFRLRRIGSAVHQAAAATPAGSATRHGDAALLFLDVACLRHAC
jgi:hypothetical protein